MKTITSIGIDNVQQEEKERLMSLAYAYLSDTEEFEYLIKHSLIMEAKAILLLSFDYLFEQGALSEENVCVLYNELNLTGEERSQIRNQYYCEWFFK